MQNFIKIGSVIDEYDRETDLNRKIQRGRGGGGFGSSTERTNTNLMSEMDVLSRKKT